MWTRTGPMVKYCQLNGGLGMLETNADAVVDSDNVVPCVLQIADVVDYLPDAKSAVTRASSVRPPVARAETKADPTIAASA